MPGQIDDAKGRVKEAVGDLADDERLKREGRRDRIAGKVKQKVGKAVDKARDAVR